MKFIIDADSPHSLIEIFNKHSHNAVHVRVILGSATDDEIFEYANKNKLIIVTRDLGFAETFIENKGYGLVLPQSVLLCKSPVDSSSLYHPLSFYRQNRLAACR